MTSHPPFPHSPIPPFPPGLRLHTPPGFDFTPLRASTSLPSGLRLQQLRASTSATPSASTSHTPGLRLQDPPGFNFSNYLGFDITHPQASTSGPSRLQLQQHLRALISGSSGLRLNPSPQLWAQLSKAKQGMGCLTWHKVLRWLAVW